MDRPLCTVCLGNPAAINYVIKHKVYYRRVCASCARQGKKSRKPAPGWAKSGYTKKTVCEKCNFKSKLPIQMFVFHVDGNLKNNDWINLKTVCANCRIELNNGKTTWRQSPLVADF